MAAPSAGRRLPLLLAQIMRSVRFCSGSEVSGFWRQLQCRWRSFLPNKDMTRFYAPDVSNLCWMEDGAAVGRFSNSWWTFWSWIIWVKVIILIYGAATVCSGMQTEGRKWSYSRRWLSCSHYAHVLSCLWFLRSIQPRNQQEFLWSATIVVR